MGTIAQRLVAAGLELPQPSVALGSYLPARRVGGLVFTAGQLPLLGGSLMASGLVGASVDLELARRCAVLALLNALSAASTVCDLDEVGRVARLTGYVACAADFHDHPKVLDAASDVLVAAFGDEGRHARSAVGVASLPLGAPVELELVLSLEPR